MKLGIVLSIRRKEKKELYWEERVINGYKILLHESLASNHLKTNFVMSEPHDFSLQVYLSRNQTKAALTSDF